MKKLLILFLTIVSAYKLPAQQNVFGIYNNRDDYKAGKLSLVCNCNSSSDKIELNHFFSKSYIKVTKDGKEYKFSKDSIFGYRDCEQNEYRFYKEYDKEYKIAENKSIVIYSAEETVPGTNGKVMQLVPHYFFSTTSNSAILPLTVLNLKRAFPDNLKFHDMLDISFADGTPISGYDAEHKMYKVNYLLSQSINQ